MSINASQLIKFVYIFCNYHPPAPYPFPRAPTPCLPSLIITVLIIHAALTIKAKVTQT